MINVVMQRILSHQISQWVYLQPEIRLQIKCSGEEGFCSSPKFNENEALYVTIAVIQECIMFQGHGYRCIDIMKFYSGNSFSKNDILLDMKQVARQRQAVC